MISRLKKKITQSLFRLAYMISRRVFFIIAGILIILILLITLRPVPIGERENAEIEEVTIKSIFEGGDNDIVFEIYESDKKYYINRGLERGLSITSLKNQLIGKKVIFRYPRYWSPLDPGRSILHLSELEFQKEILFTEYKSDIRN